VRAAKMRRGFMVANRLKALSKPEKG